MVGTSDDASFLPLDDMSPSSHTYFLCLSTHNLQAWLGQILFLEKMRVLGVHGDIHSNYRLGIRSSFVPICTVT